MLEVGDMRVIFGLVVFAVVGIISVWNAETILEVGMLQPQLRTKAFSKGVERDFRHRYVALYREMVEEEVDTSSSRRLTYLGQIFNVTEEYEDIVDAILTHGSSLSGGERMIFESADFEVKGGVVMERHENLYTGIPAKLRCENILRRHPDITTEQALFYQRYMLQAHWTTNKLIDQMDSWIKRRGIEPALKWLSMMAEEMLALETPEYDVLAKIDDDEKEGNFPTYGFHKVDTVYEERELTWLERQPSRVRFLLEKPLHCKTLKELKDLGKECYNAESAQEKTARQRLFLTLTEAQRTVFWDNYRIGKAELLKKMALGPAARAFLAKIKEAKSLGRLNSVGRYLFRASKGRVRIANPPSQDEWTVIFDAYHKAKARFESASLTHTQQSPLASSVSTVIDIPVPSARISLRDKTTEKVLETAL